MDKWEYRDVNINGQNYSELNKLGQQGWEAVGQTNQGTILLKRKSPVSPAQTVQKLAINQQINDDFELSF